MKCPVCKTSNLELSERKGIEIDYCPDCRGVWLDRGELDKILERSKSEDNHYKVEQSSHSDYNRKPYKRKKSIFEELFD